MNDHNEFDILDYLSTGADNAISARTLSDITGFQYRTITLMIESKRRRGTIICSNGDGYFLPAGDEDITATICHLMSRETEIRKTRTALEAALEKRRSTQIPL